MSKQSGGGAGGILQPSFLACVALLLAATVLAGPIAKHMQVVMRKEAVPLRKPLTEMDKALLGEYEFQVSHAVEEAIANQLGTDIFIDWQFIDTSIKNQRDPRRFVRCFLSYYTGKPDQVPHIADNCFLGAGYQIESKGNLSAQVSDLEVPIRAVTFLKTDVHGRAQPTVVYTFHCNGEFKCTRDGVRTKLSNPFDRGAYYCKIEIMFGNPRALPATPNRDDTIEAASKFLGRLIPVLLEDHLPDWQAVQESPSEKA